MLPPHDGEGRKARRRHDGIPIVVFAVHVACGSNSAGNNAK
jgi:hypothetical protein